MLNKILALFGLALVPLANTKRASPHKTETAAAFIPLTAACRLQGNANKTIATSTVIRMIAHEAANHAVVEERDGTIYAMLTIVAAQNRN